jgi:NitT/TauT family transport system substrate-binding protein
LGKFVIQPHQRLQEWVAKELGFYEDEGLDYEFNKAFGGRFKNPTIDLTELEPAEVKSGAFEDMESGRECDISSACHWAVNMAATGEHGRMWGHAYSVTPSGVWVAPESPITKPEQLAEIEVAVGYHSGSHFSALQALEPFVGQGNVKLQYVGLPLDRMQLLMDRRVEAGNVFGTPSYVLEQQGFRKILDTSFMIGFLIKGTASDEDVQKYFNALQRAQRAIDLEPELYKHYFLNEMPEKYHSMLDVRLCGIGERLVFEPYTREMYETTHRWMMTHDLFDKDQASEMKYEVAVVS